MNPRARHIALYLFALVPLVGPATLAAETATGDIRGRILNLETGEYLYQARVRVKSASDTMPASAASETFTDNQGYYRLLHVPAGPVVLEVSYTSLAPRSGTVTVPAAGEAQLDFDLTRAAAKGAGEVITLDAFVVTTSKEMSATALAVNTQRYAANTMSVVAVDELGFVGDGNIAQAMKFLPGVDLEQDGTGFGTSITLSGAPSANVPITMDGFNVATAADLSQNSGSVLAAGSDNQRTVQLGQLSLTNVSRIEVSRSPTPESPGSSLAGYVNFVPKSAFEYAKPQVRYEVFLTASGNHLSFQKTSAPMSGRETPVHPGGDVTVIMPLSRTFGFTFTASHSRNPKEFTQSNMTWNANFDSTRNNGQGTYIPVPNNPSGYTLQRYELDNFKATYTRNSANLTVDYKPVKNGRLAVAYSQGANTYVNGQEQIRWTIGQRQRDTDYTTATLTSVSSVPVIASENAVLNNTYYNEREQTNRTASVRYRHDGAGWNGDIGFSYSNGRTHNLDLEHGQFFSSLWTVPTRISFAGISQWGVGSITATTAAGKPVDPMDLRTFAAAGSYTSTLTNPATGTTSTVASALPSLRSKPTWAEDSRRQLSGNAAKTLGWNLLSSVKAGFDLNDYRRDQRLDPNLGTQSPAGFLYNGTDLPVSRFVNADYQTPMANGRVPVILDNRAIGQFFLQNPAQFVHLNVVNDYQTFVMNSKAMAERISAGYLRLDSRLLHNRLWLIYGLRFERTDLSGQGPLFDADANFQRNAAGQVIDSLGRVVGTPGAGRPAAIFSAASLDGRKLLYVTRGKSANKSYDNSFPSLNANFNVADNIVTRASYSQTVGRPDTNNIIPGIQFPDETVAPSASNAFTVSNPSLKPWKSQNASLSFEYYSPRLGEVTLRLYRRWVGDGFEQATLSSGDPRAIALLQLYGVNSADWPDYPVQTLANVDGTLVTSGAELSSRYSLDSLLPAWGRGVQIKLSVVRNTATGMSSVASRFGAQNLYVRPYTLGGAISYARSRLNLRLAAKWSARQRLNYIVLPIIGTTNPSVAADPDTYNYNDAQLNVDLDVAFRLTRRLEVFANGRDVGGYRKDLLTYSPTTPAIARGNQRSEFESTWTLGVRGEF